MGVRTSRRASSVSDANARIKKKMARPEARRAVIGADARKVAKKRATRLALRLFGRRDNSGERLPATRPRASLSSTTEAGASGAWRSGARLDASSSRRFRETAAGALRMGARERGASVAQRRESTILKKRVNRKNVGDNVDDRPYAKTIERVPPHSPSSCLAFSSARALLAPLSACSSTTSQHSK